MISSDKNTNIMIEALKGFISGLSSAEKIEVAKHIGLPVAQKEIRRDPVIISVPALNLTNEEMRAKIINDHNLAVDRRRRNKAIKEAS